MDLGRSFVVAPETRAKFDYMIGSVHGMEVEGVRLGFGQLISWTRGELPSYNPLAQIKDMDLFFKAHLALLEKEFSSQKYDILGHPTMLPPLALGKPEDAFPEWWEDAFLALLLKFGVALEISNRWKTPYDRLMQKAVAAGVRFSVGSDGHDTKKTCVLDFPREMIAKFKVPEDRLFDISRKMHNN
jgi:histidinol phosphatase-like PHP family hydrolase